MTVHLVLCKAVILFTVTEHSLVQYFQSSPFTVETNKRNILRFTDEIMSSKKVKQSHYKPGQAPRVPEG
jgi:hypothetical protein